MTKINKLLHYISTTRKFTFAVSAVGVIGGITGGLLVIILIIRFIIKLFNGSSTNIDNELPSLKPSELSQDIDNQPKISTTKSNPSLSTSSSSTKYYNNNLQTKPAIIQSNGRIETPLSHIQPNLGQGSSVPPGSDENPQGVPPPPGAPPLPPQEQHNEQQNINPPPVIQQQPPPQHQLNIVNVINPNIAEQVCDERGNVIIPKIDFSEAKDFDVGDRRIQEGKVKRYKNDKLIDEIQKDDIIEIGKKYDSNNNVQEILINRCKCTQYSGFQNKGRVYDDETGKCIYDGEFNENYQYHGHGYYYKYKLLDNTKDYTIDGHFNNGILNKGTVEYANGDRFVGNFDNEKKISDLRIAKNKFGTIKRTGGGGVVQTKQIRKSCIFEPDQEHPGTGKLYSVENDNFFDARRTLYFKGTFYEDDLDNNRFPYPKKGIFYHPNGVRRFDGEYDITEKTYTGTLYRNNDTKELEGTFDEYFQPKKDNVYKQYNGQGNLIFKGTLFGDSSYKKGIRYNGDSPDENLATKIDNEEIYFLNDKHRKNLKIEKIINPPENMHPQEDEIYGKVENEFISLIGIFDKNTGKFIKGTKVNKVQKITAEGEFFKRNGQEFFEGTVIDTKTKSEGLFNVLDYGNFSTNKCYTTYLDTRIKFITINNLVCYEIKDKNGNIIDNIGDIRDNAVYDVKCGCTESIMSTDKTKFYHYEGEICNGHYHGQGRLRSKVINNDQVSTAFRLSMDDNNCESKGTFFKDVLHGKGKRVTKIDNKTYEEEGYFDFDQLVKGTMTFMEDGSYYDIDLKADSYNIKLSTKKNGTIKEYNKDKKLIQTIEYEDDVATIKTPSGEVIFTGNYDYIRKERVSGTGKEYKKNKDGTYDETFVVFYGNYNHTTREGNMNNPCGRWNFFSRLFNGKTKQIRTSVETNLNSSFFNKYKQQ